jgi:hypothetical protein
VALVSITTERHDAMLATRPGVAEKDPEAGEADA